LEEKLALAEVAQAKVPQFSDAPYQPPPRPPTSALAIQNSRNDETAEPVLEGAVSSEPVSSETVNAWPDEAAESAFLSASRGDAQSTAASEPSIPPIENEEALKSLPKLDELVAKIPAETRELLDELFRAKFTTVRRVKKTDLKP